MKSSYLMGALCVLAAAGPASAGLDDFTTGPVFQTFGPKAAVESAEAIPEGTIFKIAFDVVNPADAGKLNRTIESAARFINMHVAAGVPLDDISLAVVVHGRAAMDLTNKEFYRSRLEGQEHGSADAIASLQQAGVTFHLCGQSAAAQDITADDLLPGVRMELSAMTTHALLQQDGYTLNPF